MSLRWRLFATYFLLLVVTLVVIVGALLVFISSRPEPPLTSYQQLASVARLILDEVVPGVTGRLALAQLMQVAEDNDTRILIVDSAESTVQFDTAGLIEQGTSINLERDPTYRLDTRFAALKLAEGYFGSFIDPATGAEWLYIGLRTRVRDFTAVLAEIRSTRTLNDALAEFGVSLAGPLIQSAVIGMVFAFLLAAVMSRQISKPLASVARAAESLARGDYGVKLPHSGPKEVRAVAEAFNTMTHEVQSTQQSQRDFLANVSHDLKTPLTSIQGYSQAIIDGAVREPAVAAEVIYSEAGRLTRMVSELTDLARLQAGHVALHLDRIDLSSLVGALSQRLEVVAQKKQVQLNVITPGRLIVTVDGDRLAQVITNLISNAINFTPEGGHIDIGLRALDNGVEIAVRDSGIGIPAAELSRVFERFYQVDKARGPQRGTGLGLAIVREIVQAHGGTISVSSEGENRGSTFTLWLPSPDLTTIMRRR